MFANAFQSGFISILYSIGTAPLGIWDKSVKNGHIRRIVDEEVKSLVLEIAGTNVATTYITCPIKPRASLGIKLPFLVMVVKNMKKYFTFEIQIIDDKNMRRRFRVSNFQSTTKVRPFCTTMPIGLSAGWNQIQFNLADFTRRAYGTVYVETIRVQIHANVRIRRIYFSDRLYSEDELPSEYKLFLPLGKKDKDKGKKGKLDKPGAGAKEAKVEIAQEPAEEEPTMPPPTPTDDKGAEEPSVGPEMSAEPGVEPSSIAPAAGDVGSPGEITEDEDEGVDGEESPEVDEEFEVPPEGGEMAEAEAVGYEEGEDAFGRAAEEAEGMASDQEADPGAVARTQSEEAPLAEEAAAEEE